MGDDQNSVKVCGRPAAPNMSFREQEISLQNVRSVSPVDLCGTLYLQISDSSLTLLFLNANIKVICFVLFLPSNFLRFFVTIVIRYCTFYICKLAYTKRLSCNVMFGMNSWRPLRFILGHAAAAAADDDDDDDDDELFIIFAHAEAKFSTIFCLAGIWGQLYMIGTVSLSH